MSNAIGSGQAKHIHGEVWAGEKTPDKDGWRYYSCPCGHSWRSKIITEEVTPNKKGKSNK